jgi:hypothetical protein
LGSGSARASARDVGTRRIELVDPVPVFLDYRTAEADPERRLRLFADIYGQDRSELLDAATKWSGASTGPARVPSGERTTTEDRPAPRRTAKAFD